MHDTITCDRCHRDMRSGVGEFYQVEISARVDSNGVVVDVDESISQQIEECLAELEETPAVEAQQDVRTTARYNLCWRCYRVWIERPFG